MIEQETLAMHLDPEVQQLEARLYAAVCYIRHIYLVFVRHNEDAIASLVSDEGIEGDRGLCLFLPQEEAATIGGGGFQGEITGRADGGKLGLQGNIFIILFVPAAAFACKSQSYYCK